MSVSLPIPEVKARGTAKPGRRVLSSPEPHCSRCGTPLYLGQVYVGGQGYVWRRTCIICADFDCDGGPREVQR